MFSVSSPIHLSLETSFGLLPTGVWKPISHCFFYDMPLFLPSQFRHHTTGATQALPSGLPQVSKLFPIFTHTEVQVRLSD